MVHHRVCQKKMRLFIAPIASVIIFFCACTCRVPIMDVKHALGNVTSETHLKHIDVTRRADYETKPAFFEQKQQYDFALERIARAFQNLHSLISEDGVDFLRFVRRFVFYESEFLSIQSLVLCVEYQQHILLNRLEVVEVLFNTLNSASNFNHACDSGGDWIDCSLADIYEIRLRFMYLSNLSDTSEEGIFDYNEKLASAWRDLERLGHIAKKSYFQLVQKWRKFEEEYIALEGFLHLLGPADREETEV